MVVAVVDVSHSLVQTITAAFVFIVIVKSSPPSLPLPPFRESFGDVAVAAVTETSDDALTRRLTTPAQPRRTA